MKSTVRGRKLVWCVNPIFPDSSLVYYGHEVYAHRNLLTPTGCYYFVDAIRAGIRDNSPRPTIYEEYSAEDLEFLAKHCPDIAVTLKAYAKKKRLEGKE